MKKESFKPHWFQYINTEDHPNFQLFQKAFAVDFINKPIFGSKMRTAIFLDGIFFPTTTGEACHIMNLLKIFASARKDVYLIRCFRGWENPKHYESFPFNTICIDPKVYYDDLEKVKSKIREYKINSAVFDTAEVVLVQGAYLKESLGLKIIYDVPNVDPVMAGLVGLDQEIVDKRITEIIEADPYIEVYWVKTEKDKKELVELGVENTKIKVRTPGLDLENKKFTPQTQLKEPIKSIYLGNLYYPPNKEALVMLQNTSKTCKSKDIHIDIDVVGDGPIEKLRKKFPQLNFLGIKPDLNEALESYELAFACPTYGSGISLKVLDYMAAGIPTVANKVGIRGHKKEIEKCVILDNSQCFCESITELLKNQKKYKKLSYKARDYINKNFDMNKIIKLYINDILEIV